jgi:hypothetical protein
MRVVRAVLLAAAAAALGGCGGSGSGSPAPKDWVRPLGAFVAPGCSDAASRRGPQYVIVTSWVGGTLTGNTGRFTGVPGCGNVIVYVDTDRHDTIRVPELRIEAKVAPDETGKLEFYAPSGEYPVLLRNAGVQLVDVVVD